MTAPAKAPLLSVVVPTKNRQEYTISLLRGIRACGADELEVVVQDNSDEPSLRNEVSALQDPRIRYFHSSDLLNMHQNFDLAVDKAHGDYVCALGDDDGLVIPAALASLRDAKWSGADALLTEMYSYPWPGTKHRIWGDLGGLVYSRRVFPGIDKQLLDVGVELEKLYRRGSVGGLGLLPRVYHGYVSRASLAALKERCGTYFPGGSPDMANAVALVPFIKTMLFDPNITLISGQSPRSSGGQDGRQHSELENVRHLPAETFRNWDPAIPRFWSNMTIYAQAAVEAARAVGLSPAYGFNYTNLCIACFVYQPKRYRTHIRSALRANGRCGSNLSPWLALEYAAMAVRRGGMFIRNFGFFYLGCAKLGRFDTIEDMMIRLSRSEG